MALLESLPVTYQSLRGLIPPHIGIIRGTGYTFGQAIFGDLSKHQRIYLSSVVNKEMYFDSKPDCCTKCGSKSLSLTANQSYVVFDLRFMRQGIKRWAIRCHYGTYKCSRCCRLMTSHRRDWQYGANLCAYIVYLLIE